MVIGDNVNIVRFIVLKCGILEVGSEFLVLDGKEFNKRIRDLFGKVYYIVRNQVIFFKYGIKVNFKYFLKMYF